jgi:hypothetical protein
MKKTCIKCGREITSQGYKKHLNSCDGSGKIKIRNTGKGRNWSKGGSLSQEQKIKISKSLIGKSTGKAGTKEKEERRKEKIAIAMKGNKNGATSFRRRNILYKDNHFKSGWEKNVAIYLDDNNINWKYEEFHYSLGKTRSYTPDFFIYENDKLVKHIEVKGYWREENKIKYEQFLAMYPNILIEVWDKKVLLSKNIKI